MMGSNSSIIVLNIHKLRNQLLFYNLNKLELMSRIMHVGSSKACHFANGTGRCFPVFSSRKNKIESYLVATLLIC